MPKRARKALSQILSDLSTAKHPPLDSLRALSDLDDAQMEEFRQGWPALPPEKRLDVMTALGTLAEETFDLNINAASRVALADPDDQVRATAIHNLWEDDGQDLIEPFLKFLTTDASVNVRTAAASALGTFVYLGELEELPEDQIEKIEAALLKVFHSDEALEVRRHALESLGYSPRPEVALAIEQAYENGDDLLRMSALFAMGRSLDDDQWNEAILENLPHGYPLVRIEAARAAGELQLEEAATGLGQLLHDPDADVQEMTVWALGQIGGEEARRFLQDRLETADEDLTELIEDALANADIVDGMLDFSLLDLDDDEDNEQERKARLN